MFMRTRIGLVAVALLSFLLQGCGEKVQGKTSEVPAAADVKKAAEEAVVIPVQAALPVLGDISEFFETTTRIIAENRVEVLSQGMGQCVRLGVDEGDLVKKGDVLAELDRSEMEAALQQSRVNVQQTKYQMQKAKEQYEKGILSSFEAENARFMHEQAVAAHNLQEVRIKNQTIVAPINGLVTRRNIQDGQMVAAGVPCFSIVDPASYVLPINPPEKTLPRLREGQDAVVIVDSENSQEFRARVRRINPSVDPATGTIKVLLDFVDVDLLRLREASFARVRLIMETRSGVLLVPKDVVIEENARRYLMVITEKPGEASAGKPIYVAERVEVKSGLEDARHMEIVSGIGADSMVVTLGQQTLKSGSLVTVTTPEQQLAETGSMPAAEALALAEQKAAEQRAKAAAEEASKRGN